jgi:hypothetical protein
MRVASIFTGESVSVEAPVLEWTSVALWSFSFRCCHRPQTADPGL